MHGGKSQGGNHCRAGWPAERGEPVTRLCNAAGAESGCRKNRRLLCQLAQRKGQPEQAATLSMECQDAFWKDLRSVSVGKENGMAKSSCPDFQTGSAKRLGRRLEDSRGLQRLAVHFTWGF